MRRHFFAARGFADGFGGNSVLMISRTRSCFERCSGVRYFSRIFSRAAVSSGVGFRFGSFIGSDLGGLVHFVGCNRRKDRITVVNVEFEDDDDVLPRERPSECDATSGRSADGHHGIAIAENAFDFLGRQVMLRNVFDISFRFVIPIDEVESDHEKSSHATIIDVYAFEFILSRIIGTVNRIRKRSPEPMPFSSPTHALFARFASKREPPLLLSVLCSLSYV